MRNKNTLDQELLVDTPTAAAMLSKHKAVLADWRHQGRGPKYVQIGRSIRYRIGDLHEWVAEHTIEPASR
jgi:predicted DNA-binding transcriptional regulator AlpA